MKIPNENASHPPRLNENFPNSELQQISNTPVNTQFGICSCLTALTLPKKVLPHTHNSHKTQPGTSRLVFAGMVRFGVLINLSLLVIFFSFKCQKAPAQNKALTTPIKQLVSV